MREKQYVFADGPSVSPDVCRLREVRDVAFYEKLGFRVERRYRPYMGCILMSMPMDKYRRLVRRLTRGAVAM